MSLVRRAWRLRTALVGQFLAAMVVATVALVLLMVTWRLPLVHEQARQEQGRVADLALFTLEQALDNAQGVLQALAGLPDAGAGPGGAFALTARQLLIGDNLLDVVYLVDKNLKLRRVFLRDGVTAEAAEWEGNDLSGIPVVTEVRRDGTLRWSSQFLSPVQGQPVVALALPYGDGVLVGELSMDRLVALTNRPNQRDGLMLLAVDSHGELVSAPQLRLVRERTNLMNLPLVQSAVVGEDAYGRFDFDGLAYNGSTRHSVRLGWGLLVAYPVAIVNTTRNASLLIAAITLGVALLVGVFIAGWLARRIDRVVHSVAAFAQEIAAGRYHGAAPGSGIVELNRLGTDLQQVAQAIGQRERQLAEQDRRFRELVENTADLVVQLDAQGQITYCNRSAEVALAGAGQALTGRNILDRVAPVDREMLQRFLTAGHDLRRSTYRQALRMLSATDQERDIAWSASVDRSDDGTLLGYRCIGIDVTRQRAAEAAVRRSEERLRTIINSTPTLAVQWFDPQGRVVEWNPASTTLFGWRREEALGRTLGELIYTPAQQAEFMALLATVERTGQPFGPYEGEVLHRDGRARWLLSTTLCISGETPTGEPQPVFVCLDVDITDRKQAEARLRELNTQLESRIAERTQSLSIANTELEQALHTVQLAQERLVASQDRLVQSEKLASLGSLVAGVAHELNTPIGNGRMAVSTVRERVRDFRQQVQAGLRRSDLDAFVSQVETGGDIALRNLERASELLTSFKQVAVDQTSDQRRRFYLREVVDEILLTLQPTFKRSTHQVVCDVPEDIALDSFPGAMGQVLTNLIQNAHIHGLEGRADGRIDITARVVRAERGEAGDWLCLRVADNGTGIPEASHRHVFDPFFTTKLGQGGSGLGLPIVRNIVTGALGGSIDFSNRAEGGVVFELRVPLVAPPAGA